MEKALNQILTELQTLNKRIGGLEHSVQKVDSKVDKLELHIENKVTEKLGALFDDREVQNERFDRLENKLDDISTDTRYLVARVARLEKLAK